MQHEIDIGEDALPKLLRGIRDDLAHYVLPELSSGDAREHAEFARIMLDRYAAELDIQHVLAESFSAEFSALIGEIEHALASVKREITPSTPRFRADIPPLSQLRNRLASSIRDLASFGSIGRQQTAWSSQLQAKTLALESRLQQAINDARQKNAGQVSGKSTHVNGCMSAVNLSAYLRRQFPQMPGDPVQSLTILPGGRSKITIFVTLRSNSELPTEIVIRQDMPGGPVDNISGTTSVRDEFPVLRALVGKGLPIATPLLLEANESECGHPFMMVERLPGKAPGTFFGLLNPQDPGIQSAVRDLAKVMGRLHSVDLKQLGLPDDLTIKPEERLRREVEYRWKKWRNNTVEPSPIVECALARLLSECKPGLGGPALVHGDIAAHNVLAHDGRITALLDWEFVHVGDPAQDLAYCRPSVLPAIPWQEFMDIYLDSGGKPVDERRLAVFGLVGMVRNCTFSATGFRHYLTGQTSDFTTGAIGYFSIPYLEAQILGLLKSLDLA